VGLVGVCRDITAWKKLQEDLIRVDRLAEIGRIAAGIAHEINNPLAIINEIAGWASTVVEDAKGLSNEDRDELSKAVGHIIEQTKRCRAITHQLLGFSRDSAPEKTEFDLHELLRKTIVFLQPELKYKDIDIVFNFQDKPIQLRSDPKMLEQVFVNLITNAIHAISDKNNGKGRIELRTMCMENYVEVAISDNGPGIKEVDKERIFDLFYTTKPPGIGTGLGLPICQNIMKKLGGKIAFESQIGLGTTFKVAIPLS
ncbi:MAG: two-component sensor histidine kinase, partial [Deltaproteobacteria bacterium]